MPKEPVNAAQFRRSIKILLALIPVALALIGVYRALQLQESSTLPIQGYLVLGGNALREVFACEEKKKHPERMVLMSGGSADPYIFLMFKARQSTMDGVWLEHCSQNTFENFVYSIPLLERLNTRNIMLVTDYPQVERAWPIAQIMCSSHGIHVHLIQLPEKLGDHKSWIEIVGLQALACAWAISSQFYQPTCSEASFLPDTDMAQWYKKGFFCQQQTGVPSRKP